MRRARHCLVWYGDGWECNCGLSTDIDGRAQSHYNDVNFGERSRTESPMEEESVAVHTG